jgi:hypothetical protein
MYIDVHTIAIKRLINKSSHKITTIKINLINCLSNEYTFVYNNLNEK